MPSVARYIFSSSILSFIDSFRSFLQCFSWCFRVHSDFISRATMISHSVLFLDFLRAIIFSPSPSSIPFSHPFISRRVFAHVATRRPISRYPLTCRRFFTRDTFRDPSIHPAHTLFLLSEGHWNRIKLYAGFSMPPFPPTAMKGGIRHDGRSGRKNGKISFERGQTKFPWPLIKRPDRSTSETVTEKRSRKSFDGG